MKMTARYVKEHRSCQVALAILAICLPVILLLTVCVYLSALGLQPCPPGHLHCGNLSQCISRSLFCNNDKDCPNGADEGQDVCNNAVGYGKELAEKQLNGTIDIFPTGCILGELPINCSCYKRTRVTCKENRMSSLLSILPRNITGLTLSKNNIKKLDTDMFAEFRTLTSLDIAYNPLTTIEPGAFRNLSQLKSLRIVKSQITKLRSDTFEGLLSLEELRISNSSLWYIEARTFSSSYLPMLLWLKLFANLLTLDGTTGLFAGCACQHLLLYDNKIRHVTSDTFRGAVNVKHLFLHSNQITRVEEDAFYDMPNLVHLELKHNNLTMLPPHLLDKSVNLLRLDLSFNPLVGLPVHFFSNAENLTTLYLEGIKLRRAGKLLKPLKMLNHAKFDSYAMCRYVPQTTLQCQPEGDGISSLKNLLDKKVLRELVWVMGCFTLLVNLLVLASRVLFREEQSFHSLFITNLCVADFLMGIYLLLVGSHDALYRDMYNSYAMKWMESWRCRVTGIIAMLSCQVSLLIICFMSVERFVTIAMPYQPRWLTKRRALLCLAGLWIFGFVQALLPLTSDEMFGEFYGSNGVCFPLHIHDPWLPGWQYSALVFIAINFIALVLMACSYIGMFVSLRRTRQKVTATTSSDTSFAMRFFLIVITDALCWTPIITFKLIALANVKIPDKVNAWLSILVLPINSAVNPVLYTLTTVTLRQNLRHMATVTFPSMVSSRPEENGVSRGSVSVNTVKRSSEVVTNAFGDGCSVQLMENHVQPLGNQVQLTDV